MRCLIRSKLIWKTSISEIFSPFISLKCFYWCTYDHLNDQILSHRKLLLIWIWTHMHKWEARGVESVSNNVNLLFYPTGALDWDLMILEATGLQLPHCHVPVPLIYIEIEFCGMVWCGLKQTSAEWPILRLIWQPEDFSKRLLSNFGQPV